MENHPGRNRKRNSYFYLCYKTSYHNEEVNCTDLTLPLQLVFPALCYARFHNQAHMAECNGASKLVRLDVGQKLT
jgi:hypothetical protein